MGQKFTEKVLGLSTLDKEDLLRLYSAVLQASQYDAFVSDGKCFRLLEGSVRKHKSGVYIFTPNATLQSLLDGKNVPKLLKIEESRFTSYIRLSLAKDEHTKPEFKNSELLIVPELPKSCANCSQKKSVSFYDGEFYLCQHTHRQVEEYVTQHTKDPKCPLVLSDKKGVQDE